MKKILVLIFSLFISGVCHAETTSCDPFIGDCYPLNDNNPTTLVCSNGNYTTIGGICRQVCTDHAIYNSSLPVPNCVCEAGFGGTGSCVQCTAGQYGPNSSNACVNCSTLGDGSFTLSAAGSDSSNDCYKNCSVSCTPQTCPPHATCTNGTETSPGIHSYGGSCVGTSIPCSITITCDTGYHDVSGSCVANTITISYNVNTGTGGATSTTCTYGGSCNLSAGGTMSKTGYTLTNWCTSSSGGTCYALGSPNPGLAIPNTNIILYAQWTANTYTITLDDGPGSGGVGTLQEVYATSWTPSSPITIPIYAGHTFTGYWVIGGTSPIISETGALPSNTYFEGNASLAAQWEPKTYSVILHNNADPSAGCIPDHTSINEIYDVGWTDNVGNPITEFSMFPICSGIGTYNGYWTEETGGTQVITPSGDFLTNTLDDDDGPINLYLQLTALDCGPGEYIAFSTCAPCTAGYYCPNDNLRHRCPAATTSDAESDSYTDCYIAGGKQICDASGVCYTFPSGTHIQWQGGPPPW